MQETLTIVTTAASDPVSVADLKTYLRIANSDEDALLTDLIAAATLAVQNYLKRTLITTTYKLTLDRLPAMKGERWWDGVREIAITELHGAREFIRLQMPAVQSITSFKYFDTSDTEQTFSSDNYRLDAVNARVALKQGKSWPTDLRDTQAIEITYVAGYGATGASVPAPIIHAIKMAVGKLYESRGCDCVITDAAYPGIRPYRVLGNLDNG